jgi:hypothetical protein
MKKFLNWLRALLTTVASLFLGFFLVLFVIAEESWLGLQNSPWVAGLMLLLGLTLGYWVARLTN